MRIRTVLLATAFLLTPVLGVTAQEADMAPLQTVARVDVERYMGRWYEIAKFPNRFQRQCVSDGVAEYSLIGDGRVEVGNRCRVQNCATDSPKFEVRFAPSWLSFLPAVWGDYWIVDLDADYSLAAVSEPKREYLWILSRTPTVNPQAYQALLSRLRSQGLDITRLESTRQSGG
jgi:apolipoprotein D and lipocalin family protein